MKGAMSGREEEPLPFILVFFLPPFSSATQAVDRLSLVTTRLLIALNFIIVII